ncbi:MAG: hypothetical protein NVV72_10850 [Asticcacaulis sp.]|nr:hypothetical protein [Asticcacaulis sp.]
MNDLDRLRSVDCLADPDPRSIMTLTKFDDETGQYNDPSLTDHHASVEGVILYDHVPQEVRVTFEVAKNLYLYSYCIYRFGVVSNVQALQALEYGLREKARLESHEFDRYMLGKLMRLAIDRGWLSDAAFIGIPGFKMTAENRYSETLAKTLPDARNILAHGSFTLFEPYRALEQIRICAAILNYVFDQRDSAK